MKTNQTRLNAVRLKKISREKGSRAERAIPHNLRHQPSKQEEYTFEEGRILLNGMDVLSMIDSEAMDIELLACLSGAIQEYRGAVWENYGTSFKKFNAQTQAILEKLLGKLNTAYEQVHGGLRIHLQGGRLWINDIDPKVVLALFLSNPTEERRRYLNGIFTKLGLILEGKVGKSLSHGILAEAKRVYIQMQQAMDNSPSSHPTPLLAVVNNMGR